jgi:hypothetical protein
MARYLIQLLQITKQYESDFLMKIEKYINIVITTKKLSHDVKLLSVYNSWRQLKRIKPINKH